MAAALPTLSTTGWSVEIREKADRLVSYYFLSEYSQTNIYSGQVASLPYHIQQYGNDEYALRNAVQSALETYLGRYFDTVRATVTTDRPVPDDLNRINLTIEVIITQDGVNHSLGRLISSVNNKIMQIVNINNNIGG